MQPFVKWAGGKRQLLTEIKDRMPQKFNTYYEPFIGGGAVFLNLAHSNSVIGDNNSILIETYINIRDNFYELIERLETLEYQHNTSNDPKSFYYNKRDEFNNEILFPSNSLNRSSLFLYLNKSCFNGLYRVNAKGLFNVPFNQKSTIKIFDPINMKKISEFLKDTTILFQDFENTVSTATTEDFIFFDSPYAPIEPTSFDSYTKEGFSIDEHIRLAKLFKRCSENGVYCMLTNHNTELIQELYEGFHIEEVPVKRLINRNADKRYGTELIITNY